MRLVSGTLTASVAVLILGFPSGGTGAKTHPEATVAGEGPAVLWRNPVDIKFRDLYYGPGGKAHQPQPQGTFTFDKEDVKGATPKFDVVDQDRIRWRVKLGEEARPEVVASRLLWAVGYFANE